MIAQSSNEMSITFNKDFGVVDNELTEVVPLHGRMKFKMAKNHNNTKRFWRFNLKNIEQKNALVFGLMLAITAPTNVKARECIDMVNQYTVGLTEIEIASAKREALARLETGKFPKLG